MGWIYGHKEVTQKGACKQVAEWITMLAKYGGEEKRGLKSEGCVLCLEEMQKA